MPGDRWPPQPELFSSAGGQSASHNAEATAEHSRAALRAGSLQLCRLSPTGNSSAEGGGRMHK